MRSRVREITPSTEATEEFNAVPGPSSMADEATPELGPNGDAVLRLLARATRLSSAERDRLAGLVETQWWPISLPAGGASGGPRATAIIRARGAGLGGAVAWLDRSAAAAIEGAPRQRDRRRPLAARAVANAALGLMVRELIAVEAFETLYGPWREVTHQ